MTGTVADPQRTEPRPRREPAEPLRRLAQRVALPHRRRQLCTRLAQKLEPLRTGGLIAVAGETEVLAQLEQRLLRAENLVAQIGGAVGAAELDTELARKFTEQDQLVEQLRGGLLTWQNRMSPVQRALDEATLARFRLDNPDQALAPASAVSTVQEEPDRRSPEQLVADIERHTAGLRELSRRAELMLMRGPIGARVGTGGGLGGHVLVGVAGSSSATG
ncbi:hypothetical protein [Pseudonocardia asaccharolytica]|uniref:Uncharacterized protein n=1 Tax=Pseudonocardia asaccharolytica DSM 44247 = NBRC 16224 TaxID=1123024 RepID=A0A511D499_9PSEU|nr:hypothetical protein [Pseudonocardia asaccharolytica]GEL19487.1 hypothetical protein PA7_33240 [Pseudonocardia asaccharolytica DSM 44247 = NBRC 16224]